MFYVVFCVLPILLFTIINVTHNVSFSGLIRSVWEERAGFSAIDYSLLCCFCFQEFPISLESKHKLRYIVVTLSHMKIEGCVS